jgi:hypothetical protein
MLGLLGADGIDVLIHSISGAHVPVGADALHGRQNLNELAELVRDHAGPAFTDVTVQRERLVLRKDVNASQLRVDAVGKRDIDDAVIAAEGDCWFCAITGKWEEALACAACQKYAKSVLHGL